jgi:AraC-like DNA-binding protein
MKDKLIKNLEDLHLLLESYRKSSRYKFRGQSNKEWKLIPKAGRLEYVAIKDDEVFRHWKRRAKAYLKKENYDEWELLAIAQHSGLSTRLLDWSHNPLTALFFCCNEYPKLDGTFFVIENETRIDSDKVKSPFNKKEASISYYQPNSSSNRLINQSGHFTIHNPPNLELNSQNFGFKFERIIITSYLKKEILFMLNQFGVNYLTQFPDLEGLSKHLNWFFENKNYFNAETNDIL